MSFCDFAARTQLMIHTAVYESSAGKQGLEGFPSIVNTEEKYQLSSQRSFILFI